MIQESFDEGLCQIETKLNEAGIHIIQKEQRTEKTGCEALLSVAHDAMEIKRMMVEIEEQHPLGRVFDIDVISGEGCPISRSQLGYPPAGARFAAVSRMNVREPGGMIIKNC